MEEAERALARALAGAAGRGGGDPPASSRSSLASSRGIDEEALLHNIDRSRNLEKEMCVAFTKYMDAVQASAKIDLSGQLKEKIDRCRDVEVELETERAKRGELQMILEKVKKEMKDLEARKMEEVDSVKTSMDEMFKESVADWQARIREADEAKSGAIEEARMKVKTAEQLIARERGAAEMAYSEKEAMRAELTAMHEAMASLHGELGAMQREIDSHHDRESALKAAADKAGEALRKANVERDELASAKRRLEDEFGTLKQAARAAMLELANQRQRTENEVASMRMELEAAKVDKSQLHTELMKALQANEDMSRAVKVLEEDCRKQRLEAEEKGKGLEEVQEEAEVLRKGHETAACELKGMQDRFADLERERDRYLEDLKNVKPELEVLRTDRRSLQKEVHRLETEKRDLMFDGQQRMEQAVAVQDELDKLRSRLNKVIESQRGLEAERDAAFQREADTKVKMEEMSLSYKEMEDALETAERDKTEALQSKKDLNESAKTAQRDAAARIVEFSQKNARMLADLTNLRTCLADSEQERDSAKEELEKANAEIENQKEEGKKLWAKIQGLEEEVEELRTKEEAFESQISANKDDQRAEKEKWEMQLWQVEELHKRELDDLRKTLTEAADERVKKAEQLRLETEKLCERSMTKTRESMKRQLEETNAARLKELADARAKASALGSALDNLTRELREEENKNSALWKELSGLQRIVGSHQYNGEVKPYSELIRENEVLRREQLQAKNRHELEVADLKRQMTTVQSNWQATNKNLQEARDCVKTLEKDTQDLRNEVAKAEREAATLQLSLEQSESQVHTLQRALQDADHKVQDAARNNDQEMERLARRNRVLQDTVSRLSGSEPPADMGPPPAQYRSQSQMLSMESSPSPSIGFPAGGRQAHPQHNNHYGSTTRNSTVLYGSEAWHAAGVPAASGFHERPPTIPVRARTPPKVPSLPAHLVSSGNGNAGFSAIDDMSDSLDESLYQNNHTTKPKAQVLLHTRYDSELEASSGTSSNASPVQRRHLAANVNLNGLSTQDVATAEMVAAGSVTGLTGDSNGQRLQQAALRMLASTNIMSPQGKEPPTRRDVHIDELLDMDDVRASGPAFTRRTPREKEGGATKPPRGRKVASAQPRPMQRALPRKEEQRGRAATYNR